jgi:hypothetical protein
LHLIREHRDLLEESAISARGGQENALECQIRAEPGETGTSVSDGSRLVAAQSGVGEAQIDEVDI